MNSASPSDANSAPATTAVDKSGDRVRRMFGEIAPQYDRMNHLLSMNVDRYWRRRTVRILAPQPGARVLDVCTGTGDLALAFNRYLRGRGEVVACDFCPQMLEIGREKSRRLDAEQSVSFHEADAQDLPWEDESFDQVVVAFGLRNVEDTDRGLREMVRVCRSGGHVAVLEFSTPRRWPIKSFYGWYFRHVLPRIGQRFAKNQSSAYDYLPQSVGEFPTYEALAERMSAAGLGQVHFRPLTFGIATLYIGNKQDISKQAQKT